MVTRLNRLGWVAVLLVLTLGLAACEAEEELVEPAPDETPALPDDPDEPDEPDVDEPEEPTELSAGRQSEWFDEQAFEQELAWRHVTPEGSEDEPWLQAIEPDWVDTSEFATEGPWDICFSNADVGNPWRVVGWEVMQEQVEMLGDQISNFRVFDAGADDARQVSDIEGLLGTDQCDLLIVSPNTTRALTPAVEAACDAGLPVIVFDRGVLTDCPVTFIKPIGGYAYGADAAEFLVEHVPPGGNIVALRILPGVDVLETRWVAGQIIMEEAGLNIFVEEFTFGDAADTKSIVNDALQRDTVHGVWMDAGATSVAAAEAFEDAGLEVPPITGEDQQDYLQAWHDNGWTAISPTYPTYQWRTPILAAQMILSGEEVPANWILPQPAITSENLARYLQPDMPPLHYALCGCEDMPGFPERWQ